MPNIHVYGDHQPITVWPSYRLLSHQSFHVPFYPICISSPILLSPIGRPLFTFCIVHESSHKLVHRFSFRQRLVDVGDIGWSAFQAFESSSLCRPVESDRRSVRTRKCATTSTISPWFVRRRTIRRYNDGDRRRRARSWISPRCTLPWYRETCATHGAVVVFYAMRHEEKINTAISCRSHCPALNQRFD